MHGYGIAFLYLERGFSSDLLICTQQNSGSLGKKLPALHKLEFPDQHKLTMIEREKIIMTRYRLIFMCNFQKNHNNILIFTYWTYFGHLPNFNKTRKKSYFYIEKWTFKVMFEVYYRAKQDKIETT